MTYDAHGADSGSVPAPQLKSYGIDLAVATNTGGLGKTGYTFAHWNTAADGSGTTYTTGVPYTANVAVTLFAQWENSYAVTYDANGATSGTVPGSQIKAFGTGPILATNSGNLAKTGYSFTGWNTAANGSGTIYSAGATLTANAATTLYATWQLNGGSGSTGGGGGCGAGTAAMGLVLALFASLCRRRRCVAI